jgi:hypothetical protein
MEVPHVLDFFTTHVRECFARAGVTGWAFPDGAPELGVDVKVGSPCMELPPPPPLPATTTPLLSCLPFSPSALAPPHVFPVYTLVPCQLEVGTALDRASRLTTEHGVGVFRSFVLPKSEQPEAFSKVRDACIENRVRMQGATCAQGVQRLVYPVCFRAAHVCVQVVASLLSFLPAATA